MSSWKKYLHSIRKKEIEAVLDFLKDKKVDSCIEFGAGDGYQTMLFSKRFNYYVSSDLNHKRLDKENFTQSVKYQNIDADNFDKNIFNKKFDVIFSSNMLEHLSKPDYFLKESSFILKEDGYAVHVIPSRLIKVSYILLHYFYLIRLFFNRIVNFKKNKKIFGGFSDKNENNINSINKKEVSKFKKIFFPQIHGNYKSHLKEFVAYGRKSWEKKFKDNGYSIVAHIKGPVFSGYGFGIGSIRKFLELFGFYSEHIFILSKMSDFEIVARNYTKKVLPRSSYYEFEKFVSDWVNKEKNAKSFYNDFLIQAGNPEGKNILDVGFGNGIILSHFVKNGAFGFGLETEFDLLQIAQKTFHDKNLNADLRLYDGVKFPFSEKSFDYVYSTSVLEHMSYPEEVLGEIARTLKDDGIFYISFPNKYAIKESHTGLYFISMLPRPITQLILKIFKSSPLEDWNLHFISYFKFKKMCKKAGLKIIFDNRTENKAKRFLKNILACLGIHYGAFLKTMIITLKRSK